MPRSFRSDNNAGLCPEALAALIAVNDGSHEVGYGDDHYTHEAVAVFREVFGPEASVWFVATGGAANALAVASLTQPWQQVICHAHSHYNNDESTGPERFSHCRTTQVRTAGSKITPADIAEAAGYSRGDVHQPQPGVVTITNATEFGTVYTPAEVRAICDAAHDRGYAVHVDGARFANAIAALACDPCELTSLAGVDALTFGGTKNGLAYGEAVLFFHQGDGRRFETAVEAFPFHRKGTGHLLSKHRFVAAPFAATLRNGHWLRHAGHANAMARRLAGGLEFRGLSLRFPAEANGVFVELDERMDKALQGRGHAYYPFGDPAWRMFRFMCSFDTTAADVDGLLADVEDFIGR